jgi:hypothetical protein
MDPLLIRASHHEAAHAVVAAIQGYTVGKTFLHLATGGEINGYTGWDNPLAPAKNPSIQDFVANVENVVRALCAGQYAEHRLGSISTEIEVPLHDANWDHDDQEARRFLSQPGLTMPVHTEEALREGTRRYVRRFWNAVVDLAGQLQVGPTVGAQAETDDFGRVLVPISPVLRNGDVRAAVRRVAVAERAYLRWVDRGCSPGGEADDWVRADGAVPRY